MPTQRFLNLKEEKRDIIRRAAMEECARVPYSEISINKIIKAADISRGSFYTYFEDKDDMIKFLLNDFRIKCMHYIWNEIEKYDGDLISAAEHMAISLMEYGSEYSEADAYRNLLLNIGTITNIKTFGFGTFLYDSEEYREFVHGCYERHNKERCFIKDERQLAAILGLIIENTLKNVAMYYFIEPEKREEVKQKIEEIVHEQLDIIRLGLQSK